MDSNQADHKLLTPQNGFIIRYQRKMVNKWSINIKQSINGIFIPRGFTLIRNLKMISIFNRYNMKQYRSFCLWILFPWVGSQNVSQDWVALVPYLRHLWSQFRLLRGDNKHFSLFRRKASAALYFSRGLLKYQRNKHKNSQWFVIYL